MSRLAYADPPYLGCGRKLYGKHHPDAAAWDSRDRHLQLLAELDRDYDAWAYSCLPRDLVWILPAVPDARIGVWAKPFCSWKPYQRIARTWEPVVYRTARPVVEPGEQAIRDVLTANMTLRRGLPGAKPEAFARWVLDLMGYRDGDLVADLFPGTDVVHQTLAQLTIY